MADITLSASGDLSDLVAAAKPDGFEAFLRLTGQKDSAENDAALHAEWHAFQREEMAFLTAMAKAGMGATLSLTALAGAHDDRSRPVEDETGALGHEAEAYGETQGDDGCVARGTPRQTTGGGLTEL